MLYVNVFWLLSLMYSTVIVFAMLTLAPLSEGYMGYCDANAARQPIQVICC